MLYTVIAVTPGAPPGVTRIPLLCMGSYVCQVGARSAAPVLSRSAHFLTWLGRKKITLGMSNGDPGFPSRESLSVSLM